MIHERRTGPAQHQGFTHIIRMKKKHEKDDQGRHVIRMRKKHQSSNTNTDHQNEETQKSKEHTFPLQSAILSICPALLSLDGS